MNWYIVKLVFKIGNKSNASQFDEQLRLIEAVSEEEAISKAMFIGEREQTSFVSSDGSIIQWKFIAISHLLLLQTLENGVELCAQTVEVDNEAYYLNALALKQDNIIANSKKAISNIG